MRRPKTRAAGQRPRLALGLAVLTLAAWTPSAQARQAAIEPRPRYVAMGSSFAAGPGIMPHEDGAQPACARSMRNYAHQLAARRDLDLVDVSCSGATTQAILASWRAMPAQIEAVDAATRLVTVTIGGNDINYVGRLASASCLRLAGQDAKAISRCPRFAPPVEEDYAKLAVSLRQIAEGVKARAPHARLVFVGYPAILPGSEPCDAAPMSPAEAKAIQAMARRLAKITAAAARQGGALFLDSPRLTREHGVCAKARWVEGYVKPAGAPYHPNLAGMTALANALDQRLPLAFK